MATWEYIATVCTREIKTTSGHFTKWFCFFIMSHVPTVEGSSEVVTWLYNNDLGGGMQDTDEPTKPQILTLNLLIKRFFLNF